MNDSGKSHPLVSIVCVTHGRTELLLRCLKSCLQQDYPRLQIIVLLNPADENAETTIRQSMSGVRIVRTHRNVGFFPGLNLAIVNAEGDYIMTFDDDAYFLSQDVLGRMVK